MNVSNTIIFFSISVLIVRYTSMELTKNQLNVENHPLKQEGLSTNIARRTPLGCYQNIHHYFLNFCRNTKIHGFEYIGEKRRFMIERLYWLMLICVSFSVCVMLLREICIKWHQFTLVANVIKNPEKIGRIPFPAITICPEIKIRQRNYNFTNNFHRIMKNLKTGDHNITSEEVQRFSESLLVCDFNPKYGTIGNETVSQATIKHLIDVAPPLEEIFLHCRWSSTNERCDHLFSPTLTDDGICFTFNMLNRKDFFKDTINLDDLFLNHNNHPKEWSPKNGYSKNSGKKSFPRKATFGIKNGLTLILATYKQDLDYVCQGPFQGATVHMHEPFGIPIVKNHYIQVPLNQNVLVAVKPEVKTLATLLKHRDLHTRQCFFFDERHLKFFQAYTQENCRVECLANLTLSRCGCVGYHMPHDSMAEICGSRNIICMLETEQEFLSQEMESNSDSDSNSNQKMTNHCNCLPACSSIHYHAEISQGDFDWGRLVEAFKSDVDEFPGAQLSKLTIYFKDTYFSAIERNEIYSHSDFLASCGGILALFTGFSFLSLAEIFYYLTLRLICNIRKYGITFWSGYSEEKS